ncbi:MAG: type II secretion system F family protein [Fimbriimonadaceae bacterium]|nr:type II secretion system F family protein [Fimbriimonadaceae bacterium]QOJ12749.1 MAG: type II secretion system F family protein [Chthonomonadaceae bacterium]
MNAFKYQGVNSQGKRVTGEVIAHHIDEAERRVAGMDITIISIVPASFRKKESEASTERDARARKSGKVRDADVCLVLRDLSVMAETGVPFVEALDAVIGSAKNTTTRGALHRVKSEIVGGKSLSAAMKSAPEMFPSVVCEMVAVAEEGGRLDRALKGSAAYLARSADLKRRIANAMLYPAVLTFIAFAAIVVLVLFVLPRFGSIFESMGSEVPKLTLWLLSVGNAGRENPIPLVVGTLATIAGIVALVRIPATRYALTKFAERLPLLGEVSRKLALSRAFQSIATLTAGNVALMSALEHSARVAGNGTISKALKEVRDSVEHGKSLSESLAAARVFPSMLTQVVTVGERTGRLPALLATTAEHLEEEVDGKIKSLVSIVEPVMIVLMGGIIGFITISIIGPIYSVVQNVK